MAEENGAGVGGESDGGWVGVRGGTRCALSVAARMAAAQDRSYLKPPVFLVYDNAVCGSVL